MRGVGQVGDGELGVDDRAQTAGPDLIANVLDVGLGAFGRAEQRQIAAVEVAQVDLGLGATVRRELAGR